MNKLLPVALLACVACAHADDDGGPAVVPYRPSVSTPAQLSAPGWVELEAGGLQARGPDSGVTRTSVTAIRFTRRGSFNSPASIALSSW